MADGSAIEWTDATWQPITGCSVVSPGCTNCYAMKPAGTRLRQHPSRAGLTIDTKAGPVWSGEVRFNEQWLLQPLQWRKPRRIFVCAHGDLFHESIPDEWIDKVFAVMALCPQHTFQVLTKRAKRMREYLSDPIGPLRRIHEETSLDAGACDAHRWGWIRTHGCALAATPHNLYLQAPMPLPNVWLGVSTERQQEADERIPELLQTPAAVRFISAEPLLGPINLDRIHEWFKTPEGARVDMWESALTGKRYDVWADDDEDPMQPGHPKLDWVITGGESGADARPSHPDWFRQIRDACAAAGVAYFHKQNGEWAPGECAEKAPTRTERGATWFDDKWLFETITPRMSEETHYEDAPDVYRLGKKAAGRSLDGKLHDEFPTRENCNGV